MTFLELCQTVRSEVGISGTGPTTVLGQEGQLLSVINFTAEADFLIQGLWLDWNFLWAQFSTESQTNKRELKKTKPDDLGSWDIHSFWLNYTSDTNYSLELLAYKEWRDSHRQGTMQIGIPTYAIVQPDQQVFLEQASDQEYSFTADYFKAPSKMTANTSESPIPDAFHRCIVARAKTMWAEREDAPEILLASSAEYQDILDKLEAHSLPDQGARRSAASSTFQVSFSVQPE
jgi:hypothetical protein